MYWKLTGSPIGQITSTSPRHEVVDMWPSPDGQRDEESYGVVRLREGKSGQQVGRSSILLLVPCTFTLAAHGSRIFTY